MSGCDGRGNPGAKLWDNCHAAVLGAWGAAPLLRDFCVPFSQKKSPGAGKWLVSLCNVLTRKKNEMQSPFGNPQTYPDTEVEPASCRLRKLLKRQNVNSLCRDTCHWDISVVNF